MLSPGILFFLMLLLHLFFFEVLSGILFPFLYFPIPLFYSIINRLQLDFLKSTIEYLFFNREIEFLVINFCFYSYHLVLFSNFLFLPLPFPSSPPHLPSFVFLSFCRIVKAFLVFVFFSFPSRDLEYINSISVSLMVYLQIFNIPIYTLSTGYV